ncbi:hypothetical protein GCM10027570_17080 [Streptomonospora sediminis]
MWSSMPVAPHDAGSGAGSVSGEGAPSAFAAPVSAEGLATGLPPTSAQPGAGAERLAEGDSSGDAPGAEVQPEAASATAAVATAHRVRDTYLGTNFIAW